MNIKYAFNEIKSLASSHSCLGIFSSQGFSEETETVLHDASHASQIKQEAPLWL